MKKRQKQIIQALRDLGGTATLREISEKTGLHVNGISQSMGAVARNINIVDIGGKGGMRKYKIVE